MMDDAANDGVRRPTPPQTDLTALKATYPRAAYLMAESWSHADHYRKAAPGRAAMDAIINGDDPQSTIAEMDRLWSGHVSQHIWD